MVAWAVACAIMLVSLMVGLVGALAFLAGHDTAARGASGLVFYILLLMIAITLLAVPVASVVWVIALVVRLVQRRVRSYTRVTVRHASMHRRA